MKAVLITVLIFFLSSSINATELTWVDQQIEAIKPQRKGVTFAHIDNPFIFYKDQTRKKASKRTRIKSSSSNSSSVAAIACKTTPQANIKGFSLSTIINSSAMINGEWYKKNDKIKGYKIVDVTKTSVTLKKGDRQLTLSTNIKKQTLKFKNK